MGNFFFDSWASLGRTAVITILAYIAMIALLRGFGKRTLSRMNAFDYIVTVALGSTLATAMLSKQVVLVDAILAFFLLMGLQFSISWLSIRSERVESWVKSSPCLLFYEGKFLRDSMKKERITEHEIWEAIRRAGHSTPEEVGAVILETAGNISVVSAWKTSDQGALKSVSGFKQILSEPSPNG